jgi:predicted anti-sigma-YlaC factor YlaD
MRRHRCICEQVLANLSDYFDGDLEAEASIALGKHLRECSTCLEFAASLCRTIEMCHEYQPPVKPRPLTPSARAQLQRAWQKALERTFAAVRTEGIRNR